jgi:hypothetical protein
MPTPRGIGSGSDGQDRFILTAPLAGSGRCEADGEGYVTHVRATATATGYRAGGNGVGAQTERNGRSFSICPAAFKIGMLLLDF